MNFSRKHKATINFRDLHCLCNMREKKESMQWQRHAPLEMSELHVNGIVTGSMSLGEAKMLSTPDILVQRFFFSSFALFRFDNDGCTLDGRRRCLRSIRICAPTLLLWPWYGYPNREYTYSAVLLLLFSFYIRAISCTRNESYANTFDACSNDAEHDQPWRCYQLAHSKF